MKTEWFQSMKKLVCIYFGSASSLKNIIEIVKESRSSETGNNV